jgi:uncharacterized protein (DUF433 family)
VAPANRIKQSASTIEKILQLYPQLAIENVHAALAYAAELAKENVVLHHG